MGKVLTYGVDADIWAWSSDGFIYNDCFYFYTPQLLIYTPKVQKLSYIVTLTLSCVNFLVCVCVKQFVVCYLRPSLARIILHMQRDTTSLYTIHGIEQNFRILTS